MISALIFTTIGYFCGSLLFAKYFGSLFAKKDIISQSDDKNPGAYNAFLHGGIACGCATATCDILKGFLPIFIYRHFFATSPWGIVTVLAAPALGHCFPIFHKFKGGKGISVSFGSLLGLTPDLTSVRVLGIIFIVFSIMAKISPNSARTLISFILAALIMPIFQHDAAIYIGYLLIACIVTAKLFICEGKPQKLKIKIFPFIKHSKKQ